MDVFRHDYISDQVEGIFSTDFCQDGHEAIASPCGSEQGAPSGTTEGDEVEISLSVARCRGLRMEEKPAPLKTARVRHPIISKPSNST